MSAISDSTGVRVRAARVSDVPSIVRVIGLNADRGLMVRRAPDEIYASIRDLVVAVDEHGRFLGCAGLHVFDSDLAEIKCLAVEERARRSGVGRKLIEACHADGRALGVRRVFTLTNAADFFRKCGYVDADREALPKFVWSECVRCPNFPVCREDALLYELEGGAG